MARALMGHIGSPGEQLLAGEIARLRRRVRELEDELAQARAEQHSGDIDFELTHELHTITEAGAPALA